MTGDIPKRPIQNYPFLWAGPATIFFNQIIQTAHWPQDWKYEHAFLLHKSEKPAQDMSKDDVRTILKTIFLSKLLENLLGDWILSIDGPYLDTGRCGGAHSMNEPK